MMTKNKKKRIKSWIAENQIFAGFAGAVLTALMTLLLILTGEKSSITQNSSGNSVINNGPVNNFMISEQNYSKLLRITSGDKRLLDNLLNQIDAKDIAIDELDVRVRNQQVRIDEFLKLETVSSEVRYLVKVGKFGEAEKLVDSNSKLVIEEEKKLASAYFEVGAVKRLALKLREALAAFDRAALLQPRNSTYQYMVGVTSVTLGEYDKAIVSLESSLALELGQSGNSSPYLGMIYNGLGGGWSFKGDLDKSVEYFEAALAVISETSSKNDSTYTVTLTNLGNAWGYKGDFNRAIKYLNRALEINLVYLSKDHPDVAETRYYLGDAWNGKGDFDRAIKYFELSLASNLKVLGEHHPSIATTYQQLGVAWSEKGEKERAIYYFELALNGHLRTLDVQHPLVVSDLQSLGKLWLEKGDVKKGAEYMRKSLGFDSE